MGLLFYRVGIWWYFFFVRVLSFTNSKARKLYEGSEGALQRIKKDFEGNTNPVAWFHCASLGEFEQGRPLMEAYMKKFQTHRILITFFSPSGYENAARITPYTYYLPKDNLSNAKQFVDITHPAIAVFIRYEFWYFYMRELITRDIQVLSVSSDFRKDQIFFKRYGRFYRDVLKKISYYFVQNEQSIELLKTLGIKQASVAGDTRFDRVAEIAAGFEPVPEVSEFIGESECLVIGSAWPSDMELLYSFINSENNFRFVIAPHELSVKFYNELESTINGKVQYLSKNEEDSDARVLIIDSIGLLSRIYGHAKYAFVGGGMGPGVHSVLEPAAYGIPVFFGNHNYTRWQESVKLVTEGGGFAVDSAESFFEIVSQLEADEEQYEGHCENALRFIQKNCGSTEKILHYVEGIVS